MTMANGTPRRLAAIRLRIRPLAVRPVALLGLGILLVVLVAAIAAPLIAPYDPDTYNALIRLSPPNSAHWFGTDQFGRDTLSRVIHSARMALLVGFGVVTFALASGVPIGVFSALFPRLG